MCCRLEERDGVLLRARAKKKSGEKENVARTAVTGKTTTITTTTNIIIIIISLGNREKKRRNIQEEVVAKSRLV
jgi:hypothetical protein